MSSPRISFVKAFFVLQLLSCIECSSVKETSYATSINAMLQLIELETKLVDCVEKYILDLEGRVNDLRSLIHELKKENYRSSYKWEEYLFNPLNAYRLIRRLYNDWPKIELFLTKSVGQEHLMVLQMYKPLLPTTTDLMEAASAIYRLQTVYDITAADLVRGILNAQQYESKLNSIDAYLMAAYLFTKQLYYPAGCWLYSSITDYDQNHMLFRIIDFGKEKPLALYAKVLAKQNRFKEAFKYIEQASQLKPSDTAIWNLKNDIQLLAAFKTDDPKQISTPVITNYELGCRGHFSNKTSNLFCLYNTTTTPFLVIAPLKMEILSVDPYIAIFHDVLSPQEIQHLQDLTKPNLVRAEVYDADLNAIFSEVRTSHTATFTGDTDEITARIQRRIVDMTGFDVDDSEYLAVVNYGIGGHYEAHYDFFNVSLDNEIVAREGDRISTVLFYLSEVEQGGATVFPDLKLAVFPRKGSALMWYNLNNRLEADARMLHAACPVLMGSKWVVTKWIRAGYQMFKKLCYK